MAESFNGGKGAHALNDDKIKQALKTGLEHLAASDALIGRTIEKCAAELDKKTEKRSFVNIILSKTSVRYCATVLAACLVVFALLLNSPAIWGNRQSTQKNSTMLKSQASDMAGSGSSPENAADSSANKSVQEFATLDTAPSASEAPAAAAPAPSAAPSPDGNQTGEAGIASVTFGKPVNVLYSLNNNGSNQARGSRSEKSAFDAVTNAYNQTNGTRLSYDESQALTVYTVSKDGVSAEALKNASSWHDLIGTESYWILSLKDEKGTVTTLLPVFETGADNASTNAYDISFDFSGVIWASSAYLGIPADNEPVRMMFDKSALEKKVLDTFNAGPVTELSIADISNGRDFMAFLTAGGKEYAIPLFTDNTINTLVNGQAYGLREAFDKLAQYLDSVK